MRPHDPTLSKSSFEDGGDKLPFSGDEDPYPEEDDNGDRGDN